MNESKQKSSGARGAVVEDPALVAFKRWQRSSGWTQEYIAENLIIGRSHLSQVLQGHREGARQTWRRLVAGLPMEGLSLLEQCPTWNTFAAEALRKRRAEERIAQIMGRAAA